MTVNVVKIIMIVSTAKGAVYGGVISEQTSNSDAVNQGQGVREGGWIYEDKDRKQWGTIYKE